MGQIAVVDRKDKILGFKPKEKCHKVDGILHRAFSVYIFNSKGQLLIQQRSKEKKLWPLYWANTCCSHPKEDEEYEKAGERRLKEELGIKCPLKFETKFHYNEKYEEIGSENEICAVLIGEYDGQVRPDIKEVADFKWVDLKVLEDDIKKNPEKYTPWLKIALPKIIQKRKKLMAKKDLASNFEELSKLVEPEIEEVLKTDVDAKFHDILKYQISTGGKRLRPSLAIISCRLIGGELKDVLYPAAGLEILHNYTLIVDDIIDHSVFRRKKPTVWAKYGRSIAECIAVDYSAAVFQSAIKSKNPLEISKIFAKAMKTIVDGEILDVLFEQEGRPDEPYVVKNRYQKISDKDYFEMAGKKSAFLLQASCEVGGICAGAFRQQMEDLRNYGFNLGVAFQIRDDILDIFGQENKFGKKIGKDIEERKLGNIVINLALKDLSNQEKGKLLGILKKKEIKNNDIKSALKLIKKTNAKEGAEKIAQEFIDKSKNSLKNLPQNKWNKILEELADFIIKREK